MTYELHNVNNVTKIITIPGEHHISNCTKKYIFPFRIIIEMILLST